MYARAMILFLNILALYESFT